MVRLNWQRPSLRYKDNVTRTMRLLARYDEVRPERNDVASGYKGLNDVDFQVIGTMLETFDAYLTSYSDFMSSFLSKNRQKKQKALDARREEAAGAVRAFVFLTLQDGLKLGHPKRAHSNFMRQLQKDLSGNIALEMIDTLFRQEFARAEQALFAPATGNVPR